MMSWHNPLGTGSPTKETVERYNEIARGYSSDWRGKLDVVELTQPARFEKLIGLPPRKILDAGCGTGKHSIYFAERGYDVYGIDRSSGMLGEAVMNSSGLRINFAIGDMRSLSFPNNFFDGVISTKAMHHGTMAQIKKLAEELERIMKPGAILMVEVPKKKKGYERFKGEFKEIEPGTLVPIGGPEKDVPHHIFSSRKELLNLFSNYKPLGIVLSGNANRKNHYTMFGKLK